MELYAFFIWPALVFGALGVYAWVSYTRAGRHPGAGE